MGEPKPEATLINELIYYNQVKNLRQRTKCERNERPEDKSNLIQRAEKVHKAQRRNLYKTPKLTSLQKKLANTRIKTLRVQNRDNGKDAMEKHKSLKQKPKNAKYKNI